MIRNRPQEKPLATRGAAAALMPVRRAVGLLEQLEKRQHLAGNGLLGEYFHNADLTSPALRRVDQTVNFNWGRGSPAPSIGADTFSVRWTGSVEATATGTHTFYFKSDDGARLWVNGQRLINRWTAHSATEYSGQISLEAGKWYNIRLEYFERTGSASAQLSWSGPSMSKQIIPVSRLYTSATPTQTPASVGRIDRLTLVNVDTGKDIQTLTDGAVLDLSKLPTRNLTVRAEIDGAVESIRFDLNGDTSYHVENAAPYALAGDARGASYYAWKYSTGNQTLTARAFSLDNARGTAGSPLTVSFSIVEGTVVPPPPTSPPSPTPTNPAAPTSVKVTAIDTTKATLAWTDNATNETGFRIERSTDGVSYVQAGVAGINASSLVLSGLSPSTGYYFRVVAVNSSGSGVSQAARGTTTSLPSDPTPPSDGTSPPIAGNWQLKFADEFDGSALSSKWTDQFWWWDGDVGDNGELQVYHNSATTVSNGKLNISATKQSRISKFDDKTYPYTSGLITTGGSENGDAVGFDFTYGYVEARVKVPDGQGIWPAFWMLPTSRKDGNGEIDIFEMIGSDPSVLETHYHVNGRDIGKATDMGVNLSDDFHTYAINWQPGSITWYIDGKQVFQTTQSVVAEPMYLMLNVAVGGDWAGAPDSSTQFPATMQVDYVKVWQKA